VKKIILPLAFFATLIACNSNSGSDTASTEQKGDTAAAATTETTTPATASADPSADPNYQKGLEVTAKSDCATCHKIGEKLVGPAFKEIAQRYAGASEATVDSLAGKVINGGSGNWGQVPMTPHPTLSKEDATAAVKYVLLLK
jgi:cytochrome c